jgi:hypothetical protein
LWKASDLISQGENIEPEDKLQRINLTVNRYTLPGIRGICIKLHKRYPISVFSPRAAEIALAEEKQLFYWSILWVEGC